MSGRVQVVFSMDVERVSGMSPTGGPASWEFGERSVRSYCDLLQKSGYAVTLVIVPDAADAQAKLFREVSESGHECGLHFHSQSWRDNYKNPKEHDFLGGYPAAEQYRILGEARDQWAGALGFAPRV